MLAYLLACLCVDAGLTNFADELRLEAVSPNAELVCYMLLHQTDDLKVPASITSMIQARIDHMKEVDQTVLKSASIIGHYVFREILQHMLHAEVDKVRGRSRGRPTPPGD